MMSVYDPLGMAAPFMLSAKVLMKQLTKENADWDAEISERDRTIWQRFFATLPCLNELVMPRVYRGLTDCSSVELHCFADASKLGFGTLCYLRTFDGSSYACSFVTGKSRVAPSPQQSIPRLELCAAAATVKLVKAVRRELDLNFNRIMYWTDSTTVLSYIKSTSKRRPVFESNRIKLILECSDPAQWRWVDTARNPADLFSRGVHPSRVHKAIQWIQGPAFLLQDESGWPARESTGVSEDGDADDCKLMAAVTSESAGSLRAGDGMGCEPEDPLW